MGSNTMELDNLTIWISVANTVFASVAFFVWMIAIRQEDEEKSDISEDTREIFENDEEGEEEEYIFGEEKHLYVKPALRNTENMYSYEEYCSYQNNNEDGQLVKNKMRKETNMNPIKNDVMLTPTLDASPYSECQSSITVKSLAGDSSLEQHTALYEEEKEQKTKENKNGVHGIPFQWPKDLTTVQELSIHTIISESLEKRLNKLGILRK